jgi:hypothetical protein
MSAEDRYEVVDALHRFAAGQDLRDAELFASAFAPQAELDFTQPARMLGAELPPFRGRDHARHLLLKNFYWVTLERSGARWLITRMRIENAWYRGDPTVLFPASATRAE